MAISHYWTIVEAINHIAHDRTDDNSSELHVVVATAARTGPLQTRDDCTHPVATKILDERSEAQAQLLNALASGEVTAWGMPELKPISGDHEKIPAEAWVGMTLRIDKGKTTDEATAVQELTRRSRWTRLRFVRAELLEKWPMSVEPYRTGAQGRPTGKRFVEVEHARRVEAGLALDRVGKEARHLAVWYQNNQPDGPKLGNRGIENIIREKHQSYKKSKTIK